MHILVLFVGFAIYSAPNSTPYLCDLVSLGCAVHLLIHYLPCVTTQANLVVLLFIVCPSSADQTDSDIPCSRISVYIYGTCQIPNSSSPLFSAGRNLAGHSVWPVSCRWGKSIYDGTVRSVKFAAKLSFSR